MNKWTHGIATLVVAASFGGLTACGAVSTTYEKQFAHAGRALEITNQSPHIPVSVTTRGDAPATDRGVRVRLITETMGRRTLRPRWTLSHGRLQLASPCGSSWVGMCEGSYAVSVPRGMAVTVNGRPAA